MNNNRNAVYALVAGAGVVIALLAGLPVYYLLLLACPVMMFFMMSSMTVGADHSNTDVAARDEAADSETDRSAH